MRVGIDLDGVCSDFGAEYDEYLRRTGHAGPFPEPQRWEFYEDRGHSSEQFLDHCHRGVNAGVIFSHSHPYPGVSEAFTVIKGAGHSIHIVTDRSFGMPGLAAMQTLRWLDKHQLPYDSITFSADKTVAHLDVMVDDKPENYHDLRAAGVDAYLLTRPWNKHVTGARRVLDLLHFAEVIR